MCELSNTVVDILSGNEQQLFQVKKILSRGYLITNWQQAAKLKSASKRFIVTFMWKRKGCNFHSLAKQKQELLCQVETHLQKYSNSSRFMVAKICLLWCSIISVSSYWMESWTLAEVTRNFFGSTQNVQLKLIEQRSELLGIWNNLIFPVELLYVRNFLGIKVR